MYGTSYFRSAYATRAFFVAGPTVWNSLPDYVRDPAVDSEQFRRDLKAFYRSGRKLEMTVKIKFPDDSDTKYKISFMIVDYDIVR